MKDYTHIFAMMPIEAFLDHRLSIIQLRVLGAIYSWRDKNTNVAAVYRSQLSERCGYSEQTVSRAGAALVKFGWLEKIGSGGRGVATQYLVTVPELETVPDPDMVSGDEMVSGVETVSNPETVSGPDAKRCPNRTVNGVQSGHTLQKNTEIHRQKTEAALPPGLSAGTWSDFLSHRKKMRAPMTAEAEKRALAKLAKLEAEGHDPEKIVDLAIVQGWKGLFERDETLKQPPPRLGDFHENRSGIGRQRRSAVDRVIAANQERLERLGEL